MANPEVLEMQAMEGGWSSSGGDEDLPMADGNAALVSAAGTYEVPHPHPGLTFAFFLSTNLTPTRRNGAGRDNFTTKQC